MSNETILVVEDEQQVRALIVRLLEKRGYRVLQAKNGREALELVEDAMDDVALVITDLIMPEMGGQALIRELVQRRSNLPYLCMTGYSQEEVVSLDGLAGAHIIEKPFSPATLLERVQNLISGGLPPP